MEKEKDFEEFEVDDESNEEQEEEEDPKKHIYIKILVILAIIIIIQIITLFVIDSNTKSKNEEISNKNLKKYMTEYGNKKLDRTLKEEYEKDYAYDEETARKDNEIKSKEILIKDYMKKAQKLEKHLNNTQPLEEFVDINNRKKKIIYDLKNTLNSETKAFRESINTKILDSSNEIESFKRLVHHGIKETEGKEINFKKCYNYDIADGKGINYGEINYALNFNENKYYLLIFQKKEFGRYGTIITDDEHDDKYLIFDMNNDYKDTFEYQWLRFRLGQHSIQLFINKVKEYKFKNKNRDFNYNKYSNITEIEIYKIYY